MATPFDPIHGALDPAVRDLAARLAAHPVYGTLTEPQRLRTFMEHHVFAVWDFMALVKSVQRDLTCVDTPWTPPADREAARLINEIVLGEESDRVEGRAISHFELYLEAMREVGARTEPIEALVRALRRGVEPQEALARCGGPAAARRFTAATLTAIEREPIHARVAILLYGREELIPRMFRTLVAALEQRGLSCRTLLLYLDRHIEVDGGLHGDLAQQLLERLCGGSELRWRDAWRAARQTLSDRLSLWDSLLAGAESAAARIS